MHRLSNLQTQQYIEELKSGSNNMLVAIRCRPLNNKELLVSNFKTVKILDGKVVILLDPINEFEPQDVFRKNRSKQMQYAFDYALDEQVPNQQIYAKTTAFLLDGVLDGYNATIFAYGATGCGKTFTMVGSTDNPGVMPRCLSDLFSKIQSLRATKQVQIRISYLEIYNQNLKDLLTSQDRNFDVREDPKAGIVISGVSDVPVTNMMEISTLLKIGNRNRSKQATAANEASSRSHAILQVVIESRDYSSSNTQVRTSKLSLVDLAGSQRASATSNRGLRMVEGAKINQSLLILGNCIQALSEATQKGNKNAFIPYRGSKLTRLLKDSLGGNCRTVMIANVSPSMSCFQDTYNTLLYANRAKSIKTNAHRNVLNAHNHLSNYTDIIQNLKRQNGDLKSLLSKNSLDPKESIPFTDSSPLIQKYLGQSEECLEEQKALMKQIFQLQKQIDNQGFYIFKLQLETDRTGLLQQRAHNSRMLVETLVDNKRKLQKQLKLKQDKVASMVDQVKGGTLNPSSQSYVLSVVKQMQTSAEKQQVMYQGKKLENECNEKEGIIGQLKVRLIEKNRTIEQQQILIQKNNIISEITYTESKDVQVTNHKPKYTLPIIKKHTTSGKKPQNPRMRSMDISVLETQPQRVQELKLDRNVPKQFRSLNSVPQKPYYNREAEKQIKTRQFRQMSTQSLRNPPNSTRKKKLDYIVPAKQYRSRPSQKLAQKQFPVQVQLPYKSNESPQKGLLPNPLYMKRRKQKYNLPKKHLIPNALF